MSIRRQIALAIAEHDAELAFAFVADTSKVISNEKFKDNNSRRDADLENQIIAMMSAQNVDKALSIGKEKLKKGFTYSLFTLAQKIYAKDTDRGREFGEDIAAKIKSDRSESESHLLPTILNFGNRNIEEFKKNPNKKPLFSESDLQAIAEITAQEVLKRPELDDYEVSSYVKSIKPFSPSRAAQIEAKYKNKLKKGDEISSVVIDGREVIIRGERVEGSIEINLSPEQKAAAEKRKNQREMLEGLNNLSKKQLPKEEKEKFIEKARQIVSTMPDSNEKIVALSLLAMQVKQLGDNELASELMSKANALVNPQPVNYMDYMQTWMLAGGYSEVNAEKAFPILENAVYKLNEMVFAFIKVGEFVDVSGSMIHDGEVQLGMFGGGMVKTLLTGLGDSDRILVNLAIADFDRTRELAEKFEKPEVRLMAKLLILRSVLDNTPKSPIRISTVNAPPPPAPRPPR